MPQSWSNDLLTGMQIIDSQHREFFARADSLMAQCMEVGAEEAYAQAFAFLRAYVDEHLATEERLMAEHEFPQSPFHTSQHRWFKAEIDRIHEAAVAGGPSASVRVRFNYLLVDWFRSHIRGVDMKLVAYLRGRSASPGRAAE